MLIMVLLLLFYSWNTSKQHKARTIEDIESRAGNSRESYSVSTLHCYLLTLTMLFQMSCIGPTRYGCSAWECSIAGCTIGCQSQKKQADPLQRAMLQKLVESIQACGVPFQIWRKDSGSSALDWTSLGGAGMRKVISELPAYFKDILP